MHLLRFNCSSVTVSDDDDDSSPFEKLARDMEDISGDNGVLKKVNFSDLFLPSTNCTVFQIIFPGVGSDLPANSTVTFNYNCYLEYGDEPFDSSHFIRKPRKTCLADPDVIKGLAIGLRSMRLKEKARFLIRHDYAFGKVCLN